MVKPPSVIIIARHGARLDAENKDWHLTATEPYDTPLTYGGWTQTRALGARIASLLHARGNEVAKEDTSDHSFYVGSAPVKSSLDFGARDKSKPPKRRKHKVVVHTSPYLRCVQSSLAICAGIAQYEGNLVRFEKQENKPLRPQPLYTPIRSKTLDPSAIDVRYGHLSRPGSSDSSRTPSESGTATSIISSRPVLRVDAFLGEWQSPDYYENMTHPPPSNMIVAGAKLNLQKEADPIQGSQFHENFPPRQSVSSQSALPDVEDTEDASLSLGSLAKHLPGTNGTEQHSDIASSEASTTKARRPLGYFPPTPSYAISTSAPIPEGYVAHARDAVVDIDFQWDSMRPPQDWPDGGEYGEEWSAMHNRFRRGFMNMLDWYKQNGTRAVLDVSKDDLEEDDDETDTVLILVTHSAGCNALIGALTNQPVLLDVGMASLTMAIMRDRAAPPRRESIASRRRRSVVDTSQADEYEVKLIASTDHLRAGGDLLRIPALATPPLSATRPDSKRNRGTSLSAAMTPMQAPQEPDRSRSKNTSLGSIRRIRPTPNSSIGSFQTTQDVVSPSEAGGLLWGARRASVQSSLSIQEEADIDPLTPEATITPADAYMDQPHRRDTGHTETSNRSLDEDVLTDLPSPGGSLIAERRASQQRGLWGAPPRQENKRRWTVSDR